MPDKATLLNARTLFTEYSNAEIHYAANNGYLQPKISNLYRGSGIATYTSSTYVYSKYGFIISQTFLFVNDFLDILLFIDYNI